MSSFVEEGKRLEKQIFGKVYKELSRVEGKITREVKRPFTMPELGVLASPTPTSKSGPAPTTVMAAKRAEADRQGLKKRRRASVMGGDYGSLNVQTYKLGT